MFSFIPPPNAKKIKIFRKCVIVAYFCATFWLFWGIGERRFSKRTGFDDLQAKVQNRNTSLLVSLKKQENNFRKINFLKLLTKEIKSPIIGIEKTNFLYCGETKVSHPEISKKRRKEKRTKKAPVLTARRGVQENKSLKTKKLKNKRNKKEK